MGLRIIGGMIVTKTYLIKLVAPPRKIMPLLLFIGIILGATLIYQASEVEEFLIMLVPTSVIGFASYKLVSRFRSSASSEANTKFSEPENA